MGKDIDTTGAFAHSAFPTSCLPGAGSDLDLDLSSPLDLDLSEGDAGLDLDLSEGPGFVDGALKNADTQPFDPSTDRVVFQVAPGPAPQR